MSASKPWGRAAGGTCTLASLADSPLHHANATCSGVPWPCHTQTLGAGPLAGLLPLGPPLLCSPQTPDCLPTPLCLCTGCSPASSEPRFLFHGPPQCPFTLAPPALGAGPIWSPRLWMWRCLRREVRPYLSPITQESHSDSGLTAIPRWDILATSQLYPVCPGSPKCTIPSGARCLPIFMSQVLSTSPGFSDGCVRKCR